MIRAEYRVFGSFFLFAVALGALLGRLPDLQRQLGLSESQLGLTLIAMACGSLISLTFTSPWIERHAARTTTLLTVCGTAICYAIVPWLPNVVFVFAALFVAGFCAGMLELVVNLQSDRIEAQIGKRVLNRAHGSWSLGFFVTSLAAAAIRQAGVSIQIHTAAASGLVILAAVLLLRDMTDAPRRPGTQALDNPAHRIALPNLALVPLCIIAVTAFLIEGTGVDWSVIYMRDTFAVAPFIGGLGLTLFTGFMTIGRLFADTLVDRFGPRAVATAMLAIAATGTLIIGFSPTPWLALAGFAMIGLGSSGVYPLAISAAARRTDRPAAINTAAVAQVSFVAFFAGPPLLGTVAEYLGIRMSYLIVLPLIVAALMLVQSLAPRPAATPARADA
jgi:MFS family permease